MNKVIFGSLAAVAAVAMTGPAAAQSVSQTFTFTPQTRSTVAGAYFDSSLGTLNSVVFSGSFDLAGNYTISNPGPGSTSGTAGIFTSILAITQVSSQQTQALQDALATFTFAGAPRYSTSNPYSLSPGASATFAYNSGVVSRSYTDTAAADLAAFSAAGGGSFDLTVAFGGSAVVTQPTGNYTFASTQTGPGRLTITYNYAALTPPPAAGAVPEPATWAMMIVGMGAMGCAMRRRKVSMPVSRAA